MSDLKFFSVLQGFDADHRDIELLKLRNFTIGKKGLPDSVFTDENGQEKISDIIRAMVGFVSQVAMATSVLLATTLMDPADQITGHLLE